MTESGVKRWLTEKLGQPIPAWVWDGLVDQAHVRDLDALDDPVELERGLQQLLHMAKEAMKALQGASPTPKRTQATADVLDRLVSASDLARVHALSDYIAAEARERSEVRRLRQRVLGDRLLSPTEVGAFVTSLGVRTVPLLLFERKGVSPFPNEVRIVREVTGRDSYLAELEIAPGHVVKLKYDGPNAISPDGKPEGNRAVEVYLEDGGARTVTYWATSVLDDIHAAATELARCYPWSVPEAIDFILTGSVPLLPAIAPSVQLSRGAPCSITLTVRPWVSPKLVAHVYQNWRDHYFSVRPRRPVSERNLAVFRFVVQQETDDGTDSTWRGLMRAWNSNNPDSSYDNVRRFRRDFDRAARVIRTERYGLDWPLPAQENAPTKAIAKRVTKGKKPPSEQTRK